MMKIPKELLDKFGVKRTEIIFTKPVKVMIRSNYKDNETVENATSISIEQGPICTSVFVSFQTKHGEGTTGSAVENINEIIVVNE